MSVIQAAIKAVPAVSYALGLAGIAAAASIIGTFVGTGVSAVATMGLLLVGMVVLYLFSALTTQGNKHREVPLPAKVILWVITICVSILVICLTTAVTFAWPENLARLLGVERSTVAAILSPLPDPHSVPGRPQVVPASPPTRMPQLQAKFGYIYLGRREDDRWVDDQFAYGRILDSDDIPVNGDIRTIVQGVHLRKAVPDETTPLVMAADLGAIPPGTEVRIKTVTRLDPGGYYWASVDILD